MKCSAKSNNVRANDSSGLGLVYGNLKMKVSVTVVKQSEGAKGCDGLFRVENVQQTDSVRDVIACPSVIPEARTY
jgi:hypothetical protein